MTQSDMTTVSADDASTQATFQDLKEEMSQLEQHIEAACATVESVQTVLGLGASRAATPYQTTSAPQALTTYVHLEHVKSSLQDLKGTSQRYLTALVLIDVGWKWIEGSTASMAQSIIRGHLAEVHAVLRHVFELTAQLPGAALA